MSVLPTWQGIPDHIKEDIVSYLDYKSRFRLRVCSKSDLNLVDGCPIIPDQVEIYATPYERSLNFPHVLYINNSIKICHNVVDHFFGIFKHQRSTVERLILGFNSVGRIPNAFVGQLVSKIESLKGTFRIKVKEIQSYGNFDEGCLEILKISDPQVIVSIFIKTKNCSLDLSLVQLGAWKNAKNISIRSDFYVTNIPIDSFLHAEKFRLAKSTFVAEDAWKLVNTFTTRSRVRPGFGFCVTFCQGVTEEQLLSKFEVEPRKVPVVGKNDKRWLYSCYHFPTTDPELILSLETRTNNTAMPPPINAPSRCSLKLKGLVVRKSDPFDGFDQFRNWAPVTPPQLSQRMKDNHPPPPQFNFVYHDADLNTPPSINPPSQNPVVEIPVVNVSAAPADSLYVAPNEN